LVHPLNIGDVDLTQSGANLRELLEVKIYGHHFWGCSNWHEVSPGVGACFALHQNECMSSKDEILGFPTITSLGEILSTGAWPWSHWKTFSSGYRQEFEFKWDD